MSLIKKHFIQMIVFLICVIVIALSIYFKNDFNKKQDEYRDKTISSIQEDALKVYGKQIITPDLEPAPKGSETDRINFESVRSIRVKFRDSQGNSQVAQAYAGLKVIDLKDGKSKNLEQELNLSSESCKSLANKEDFLESLTPQKGVRLTYNCNGVIRGIVVDNESKEYPPGIMQDFKAICEEVGCLDD